ncbi:MAG: ParA family protein [Chitinivibrionales bacterium]
MANPYKNYPPAGAKKLFMKIVSILNHKGGVGKTTFTGSMAQALALVGFRVLVIDNDSQHNLSSMLGLTVQSPNIRDVYQSTPQEAPRRFLKAIRKTDLPDLHCVTSPSNLCDADVGAIDFLKQCLGACGLERFYDFVLIDNAPGMDRLQASAILACHEIFVPIELRQFAVDGIVEMEKMLTSNFPNSGKISRIIPNFYRDTIRQKSFVAALQKLFPGKVTRTAIPLDPVFDEVITEGKILFLHRLASKGAAFYLKLIHELFDLDEEKVWEMVMEKRNERRKDEARQRFWEAKNKR